MRKDASANKLASVYLSFLLRSPHSKEGKTEVGGRGTFSQQHFYLALDLLEHHLEEQPALPPVLASL